MLKPLLKRQRGFTLIELLAVIAILTVLSGIVAGAITAVGASGQTARLEGDGNTIGKAADRFFNEAFPQRYPVASCCAPTDATPQDLLKAGDLGVRLIDFGAVLPGNPTKTFVPSFLKKVPDTAGLVSWRIDTRNGDVFFAQDGTPLVRPSTSRLDVSAATGSAGSVSDYALELRMKKNEAALAVLEVAVPAGYSVGSFGPGTLVGTLTGTFSTDNPWSPGQVLAITGSLKATGDSNKWELLVDYPDSANKAPDAIKRADGTHQVTIATPSQQAAGSLTLKLDTTGDPAHNQATETWELTIYGQVTVGATTTNVITNPVSLGVYRWLAREHTSIDVPDFFQKVDGNQAVVLKGNSPPVAHPQTVITPEDIPATIILMGSDPEGDPVTFRVLGQPSHGTLTGTAPNLVYTPRANFNGQDSFTFKVDDGKVASRAARVDITVSTNSVSITVTPVNDRPVFDAIAAQTVNENGGPRNVSITGVAPGPATATDEAGQTVTMTANSNNTGLIPNPTISGAGATRILTYAPVANRNGTAIITVVANDGQAQNNVFSRTFTVTVTPAVVTTGAMRPGFNSNAFPGNDDGSTGPVAIGFPVNFFGRNYSSLFINNNGNLTFDGSMGTFTPFRLTTNSQRVIIAPFFADVHTGRGVGQVVTYGTGTVDGRPAFGVNWPGVACFGGNSGLRNDFQVVLIDRSDISVGGFDIEFNYNRIQWETGTASGSNSQCRGGSAARVGFSNGTRSPGTFFELPGSGVSGSFLDSNAVTGLIHHSLNTSQRGRYVFSVVPNATLPPSALTITTPSLPSGRVGVGYNQALQATGGTAPLRWAFVSGNFPPGLALAPGGAISGSPTQRGRFTFIARVTDSSTPPQSDTLQFRIRIR